MDERTATADDGASTDGHERELRRTNRALRMLSDSNQALMRMTDEAELVDRICRIAVEVGGYRLAWVGYAEHDAEKTLHPVAHAGAGADYVARAKVSWGDGERGRGPGGTAIRTGKPCLARNIHTDPSFAPWREAAIRHNYASLVALPLINDGEPLGAMGIYSSETDAFDDEEMKILEELAGDLTFGIAVLRTRARQEHLDNELRKAEEKYRIVADFTYDWEYWLTPTGRFSYVSPSCERITGYGAQQMQESPDLLLSICHPEDRAKMRDHVHGEQVTGAGPCEIDFRIVTRSGEERWIAHTCQTVRSPDGALLGWRGSNRDITKRKHAEMALASSEAKMRSILENVGIGVSLISPNMEILDLNRRMREWFPHVDPALTPVCYRAFNDPPRDEVCSYCPTVQTLRDGLVHESTSTTPQQGRVRNYRIVSSPILDVEGRVSAAIEMVEDITEKLSLEAQLRQAHKLEAIGRLAGGVAHDFNNKLAVIIGYAELALESTDLDEPVIEALREIHAAASRSSELTRQLLIFARQHPIAPQALDMNEIVEASLKMIRRLIGEDIKISWVPEPEVWHVLMDRSQIDQILTNLCVNSRDAIDGVGEIVIRTENVTIEPPDCAGWMDTRPGQFVRFSVEDSGCGMDRETLARVFEPFFTTKESGSGTGLGLATVYGIVQQNEGVVEIHSEPGKGTRLDIYLPRHEASVGSTTSTDGAARSTRGTETILLVEDDLAILNMAKQVLERQGYRVLACSTPRDAIRSAKKHRAKIDLLVTDVVMPEMNGRELQKALAGLCPGIKHLFMSGYSGDIIAQHGLLAKDVAFIRKPFSIKSFVKKVREVL